MSGRARPPEIAQLRAFCAAVDLGSLGRAARLLRVSQPAVSKRLRALEDVGGTRLLDRSSRGVTPTAAGRSLYLAARKLLAEADAVEGLIGTLAQEEVPVRLAASPTIAEFALPAALVELESQHERHLSVELTIANSSAVRALVVDGRAELGLAAVDPEADEPNLVRTHFLDDEVIVAVPASHRWAALEAIELDEFAGTSVIMRDPRADSRRTVARMLKGLGRSLAPPLAEIGSTSAAKTAALSEGAPALLSLLAVGPDEGLVVRRVRGARFQRAFALFHGGEKNLSPGARALAEHLLASAPAAEGSGRNAE